MTNFSKLIQAQFDKMCASGKLFRSNLTGSEVWDIYLGSFNSEDDPIFRDPESTVHNCNNCKNFMRRYGNIVSIDENYEIVTMFDIEIEGEYKNSAEALSNILKTCGIASIFTETFDSLNGLPYEVCKKTNTVYQLGIQKNTKRYTKEEAEKFGVVKANETRSFNHLNLQLPAQFVDKSGNSVESIVGSFRDAKNVFERGMEEIPLDVLNLVRDLIIQGSLLDGTAHLFKLDIIAPLKEKYDSLPESKRSNWCWVTSYKLNLAKFKNELIGTLCSDIASGIDLNTACQLWNKRVDPINYMKTTAPITRKQIEEAKKFVEENNYVDSFDRRCAVISDIKVAEILHCNSTGNKIKNVSIFDDVKPSASKTKSNDFGKVEEVGIDKFMSDILPSCTSVEVYLENKQENNLVTLTTSNVKDSKPIFKWDNNFSWTFKGNIAGKSQIKEAVKTAGGAVDGVLRFSIIWNDAPGHTDRSDLDAWCKQPDGSHIGYSAGYRKDRGNTFSSCKGQLDLDNTNPGSNIGIENIYFVDINALKNGYYSFWVHQFSDRGSKGFKAEIEFDGNIYSYEYNMKVYGIVNVAKVNFNNGVFTIKHDLPETHVSKEIYGLQSEEFHKVNLLCLSPNHWGDNSVGNKYYLFMLEGCKSPDKIRGFHNENLIPELLEHKRVLEVLGSTSMVESTEDQLSGLGFNATVRDSVILRLKGSFNRMIKVLF